MTVVLPSADARTRAPHAMRVAGKGTDLRNAGALTGTALYADTEGGAVANGPDELLERLATIEKWRFWQFRFPDAAAGRGGGEGKEADKDGGGGGDGGGDAEEPKLKNPLKLGKFEKFKPEGDQAALEAAAMDKARPTTDRRTH